MLGVRIHAATRAQALEAVDRALAQGRPLQIATVNPEFVMAAQRDGEFLRVLNEVDLAVADGVGLVIGGRLLGLPLSERVAGVDLVRGIAGLAAARSSRLFLLGAAEGVAEATAARLRGEFPGLCVCDTYSGSPDPEEEEEILARVTSARADILLVAFGAPRQDLWLRRTRGRHPAGVTMGVGGAFDFISGRARRAPGWLQTLGLEWLHRLLREPWRWRRMLALPRFALAVLRQRLTEGRCGDLRQA